MKLIHLPSACYFIDELTGTLYPETSNLQIDEPDLDNPQTDNLTDVFDVIDPASLTEQDALTMTAIYKELCSKNEFHLLVFLCSLNKNTAIKLAEDYDIIKQINFLLWANEQVENIPVDHLVEFRDYIRLINLNFS